MEIIMSDSLIILIYVYTILGSDYPSEPILTTFLISCMMSHGIVNGSTMWIRFMRWISL